MCEGLFAAYPIKEGESTDALLAEHFPDVVKIGITSLDLAFQEEGKK